MGTTGSGSFSDYSGSSKGSSENDNSNQGSSNQGDKCDRSIGNILLEEVAHCDFYSKKKNIPSIGTEVNLKKELISGRLMIELDGESLGCLPTKYNYLRACMETGFEYNGIITDSSATPFPKIIIDLGPIK